MSGQLPMTGAAVTILGISFGLSWLVGLAVLLICSGVIVGRVASRADRR